MQTVTIEQGPVSFPAGTLLTLDPDQLRRRRSLVEDTGTDGVLRARVSVQFKTGETLGTDADIPKSMTDRVTVTARAAKPKAGSSRKSAPASDEAGGE